MASRTYIEDGVIRRSKPESIEEPLKAVKPAFYGRSRRLCEETSELKKSQQISGSKQLLTPTDDTQDDFSPIDPSELCESRQSTRCIPLTTSEESSHNFPSNDRASFLSCAEDEISLECILTGCRDCVLVLYPCGSDPAFSVFDSDLRQRLEFLSKEFHVFLRRVSNLNEAIGVMFSLSSVYNIIHLEIGMHGTRDSISFSNEIVTVGSSYTELIQLFTLMDPRGTILSLCCRNGELPSEGNMVEYLATLSDGREVTGLTCDNGKHLELKITIHPLSIVYTRNGVDVTTRCRI